ncbi:MAG TPA: response regulator [Nitrospiraceae bacterium]|nr:response regulator [Nitrospiraceae bacterium]
MLDQGMGCEGSLSGKQRAKQQVTILVVDDDAGLCHLTRFLLTQYGYTALHALNAEAALHVSTRYPGQIDLLLVDIAMAGMSGPQLAQALRITRPGMHLLFMSGLVTEKNFQGVLGGRFLRKPFTPSGLIETIEAILHPNSGTVGLDS